MPNEALRFQPRGSAQAALVRDTGRTGVNPFAGSDRQGARLLGKAQGRARARPRGARQDRRRLEAEFAAIRNAAGAAGIGDGAGGHARAGAAAHRQGAARRAHAREIQALRGAAAAKAERSAPGTIWTYEGGTLVPHEVRLGLADGYVTEITDGLGRRRQVVAARARALASDAAPRLARRSSPAIWSRPTARRQRDRRAARRQRRGGARRISRRHRRTPAPANRPS